MLEDLHWSDHATLDLIAWLTEKGRYVEKGVYPIHAQPDQRGHAPDGILRPPEADPTRGGSPMTMLALDDPAWSAFVEQQPEALPFHHPAWVAMVADTYRLRAFVVVVEDAAGAISAGIPVIEVRQPLRPRRWVALPFTDFCSPLRSHAADERSLVESLGQQAHEAGARRVEVHAPLAGAVPFEDAGFRHLLELDRDPTAVYARFHPSQVQRNIRRAEREGLQLRVGTARDDLLDTFYELHLRTRRRLGVLIQPRRFFRLLRERVLAPGLGRVIAVEAAGRPVAAAVFLAWNQTVVYKFGASDADAWQLRPNHLLLWHAIRSACEDGYRWFDFGQTDPRSEGLRAFKRSWGTEEQPLVYHALGAARPSTDPQAGVAGRLLGGVIRHAPLWVCRMSGELLYRFVA